MHTILIKTLLAVITKIVMAACGEAVITWLFFKLAEEMAKSTKTAADDEFVEKVKASYEQSKERAVIV
jgi:hypothetical protein